MKGFRVQGFRACDTFREHHHARRVVWCAPRFTDLNPPTQFTTLVGFRVSLPQSALSKSAYLVWDFCCMFALTKNLRRPLWGGVVGELWGSRTGSGGGCSEDLALLGNSGCAGALGRPSWRRTTKRTGWWGGLGSCGGSCGESFGGAVGELRLWGAFESCGGEL